VRVLAWLLLAGVAVVLRLEEMSATRSVRVVVAHGRVLLEHGLEYR